MDGNFRAGNNHDWGIETGKFCRVLFFLKSLSIADEWPSGKGVRLSILDVVLDTSSIPSSANKFNVSG